MRAAFALLVALPLLSGCLDGRGGEEGTAPVHPTLSADDIIVPTGGVLQALEEGFAAVWNATALPFTVDITIPANATMVRAVAMDGTPSSVSMSNAETGRRRCNNPTVESFSLPFSAPRSCSGVALIDAPGTVWRVNVGGTGTSTVRVEYLHAPLDGLSSQLDFTLIDPPVQSLEPTVVEFIPSFDGVLLRTERTLPSGPGPFPTVIVSSPYYTHTEGAAPADWNYVVHDWAKRGYAMVTADVRGFADSGGCVEVWGPNEQRDQAFLVDWVAQQPWSDGNVGFYGQSYVGTTPVEAAVQAPEALKAIVTIAPVINAYEDWHYGGVPNGENELSPVAYQVLTESTVTEAPGEVQEGAFLNDPAQLANNAKNGLCDPTLVVRANDPRATYNAFYDERNFKTRAKDVKAAVLYTEGFEDANVKSAMIPGWFNDLQSPKLGLFGHWLHQHPSRLDCEALFVGWFEQYLKGKDIGFDRVPAADIQVDRDTHRFASEWPPSEANAAISSFGADLDAMTWVPGEGSGSGTATLNMEPSGSADVPEGDELLVITHELAQDMSLAGSAFIGMTGQLTGASAYIGAYLYEVSADGDNLVTWGRFNTAHDETHRTYTPATPTDTISFQLPTRPTEHVFKAGNTLRVEIRGVDPASTTDPFGVTGTRFEIQGIDLTVWGAPLADYEPIPLTVVP